MFFLSEFVEGLKQIVWNMLDEKKLCDIQMGTVVSEKPLRVRLSQKLVIQERQLYLTAAVRDWEKEFVINGETCRTEGKNHLKAGEKVLLIRSQGGQSFLVIDRLANGEKGG